MTEKVIWTTGAVDTENVDMPLSDVWYGFNEQAVSVVHIATMNVIY